MRLIKDQLIDYFTVLLFSIALFFHRNGSYLLFVVLRYFSRTILLFVLCLRKRWLFLFKLLLKFCAIKTMLKMSLKNLKVTVLKKNMKLLNLANVVTSVKHDGLR